MLVMVPGSCVAFWTCVAVNVTIPVAFPVMVISPVVSLIVAILVLLDEYTIGELLLLVGSVVGINGVLSDTDLLDGTTNDDVFKVFDSNTRPKMLPTNNQIGLPPYVIISTISFVA